MISVYLLLDLQREEAGMPCGKTAGNSGNDDAGERMERKIEEHTEGRGVGKEYRLRQLFFNDNHFLTTIIF